MPDAGRVLIRSEGADNGVSWLPLGADTPSLLAKAAFGLVLSEAPVLDQVGAGTGKVVLESLRVRVLEAGPWERFGGEYRMLYRVESEAIEGGGWLDSSGVALVIAQDGELSAGVVPRRIVVGGGTSEYSLLAVAAAGRVTLVDTSVMVFPDAFHPSGVRGLSIRDCNGDGRAEIVLEAETIVSLRYLGATPLRWVAWLDGVNGAWAPIFRFDEDFATDAGYSYTARARAFDSTGSSSALLDSVRVDTDYVITTGESEFLARTVAFSRWDGTAYRKVALQDLPRKGTVTAEETPLRKEPGVESGIADTLHKGDELFVFDRSDARQSADDPQSWWYQVVTKSGAEGWASGSGLDLAWIDALKINREVFLGLAESPR
jgi:hypothetical protein